MGWRLLRQPRLVLALARAQIAFTHGEEVANKTPEPGILEMMTAAILIQNDLECAESIVAPYRPSKTKFVPDAADLACRRRVGHDSPGGGSRAPRHLPAARRAAGRFKP